MSESSAAAPKAQASAFPDGTTDYVPLRAGGKYDLKKVHISETPITWGNWYKHVNWLNTTFIVFIPLLGFVSAYWVPLKLATAIFSVIYYFNTGLGITAGKSTLIKMFWFSWISLTNSISISRIPPSLGSLLIQGHSPPQNLPCRCRCWRRRRLHPLVVKGPPLSPPIHRHRQGPLLRPQGSPVLSPRLDGHEAEPQANWPHRHH
jgi:hypothetical protein